MVSTYTGKYIETSDRGQSKKRTASEYKRTSCSQSPLPYSKHQSCMHNNMAEHNKYQLANAAPCPQVLEKTGAEKRAWYTLSTHVLYHYNYAHGGLVL